MVNRSFVKIFASDVQPDIKSNVLWLDTSSGNKIKIPYGASYANINSQEKVTQQINLYAKGARATVDTIQLVGDIIIVSAENYLLNGGVALADSICLPTNVSSIENGHEILIFGGNSDCVLFSDSTRVKINICTGGYTTNSQYLTIGFADVYRITLIKDSNITYGFTWLAEKISSII